MSSYVILSGAKDPYLKVWSHGSFGCGLRMTIALSP
jgi:hypothetical protein